MVEGNSACSGASEEASPATCTMCGARQIAKRKPCARGAGAKRRGSPGFGESSLRRRCVRRLRQGPDCGGPKALQAVRLEGMLRNPPACRVWAMRADSLHRWPR